MPRASYTPKNRYVWNSNLGEGEVAGLLLFWVQGATSFHVHDMYNKAKAAEPDMVETVPSAKTIDRLFLRLSHYVYDRLVISRLGEENPALPELMREQPEMMRSFLYDLAEATLHYTLYGSTPEEFAKEYPGIEPVILRDEVCHEMRILARNRFGKKYDARSVIAMAMFRSDARHITGEEFVGEKSHKFMHEVMLNWLEEMPLR